MELIHTEIISALLAARRGDPQITILVSLILDLFMEVEAMREALIRIDNQSTYQRAYLDAAVEMHNNEGEYGGLDKLLSRFYPTAADSHGRSWRECLLLERLGFSPIEIAEYKIVAQDAEMLT
jgi:hypothetical protein